MRGIPWRLFFVVVFVTRVKVQWRVLRVGVDTRDVLFGSVASAACVFPGWERELLFWEGGRMTELIRLVM